MDGQVPSVLFQTLFTYKNNHPCNKIARMKSAGYLFVIKAEN